MRADTLMLHVCSVLRVDVTVTDDLCCRVALAYLLYCKGTVDAGSIDRLALLIQPAD